MEPEDNMMDCEDEFFFDPTRITLKVNESILFDTGLQDFYSKQEFTGEPTYIGLTDYDVVISVTRRDDDAEKKRIITDTERAIRAYIAKQSRKLV